MDAGVAIDDRRDAIVRADLQEFRVELFAFADVDGVGGIGQADFLEHDRGLAAVGRGPGVEIDHGFHPVLANLL